MTSDAPIDAPESKGLPSRSVIGFRVRAVPDGVGPPNFLKNIPIEQVPSSLRKYLEEYSSQEDADNGHH